LDFVPTRQPIVLDLWEQQTPALRDTFTTVARWRKPKEKTIEFRGEVYRWNKDVEFEKFLDLPARSRQSLELALSEIDSKDRLRLEAHGWNVVDAIPLSSSIDTYRTYIQGSRGEFTIAKDQYVRLDTGWFSDRSACYLAAGRPVITQETGFSHVLPTGDGLFAFRTLEDVLAAIDAINGDYERHSEAAREIAREYFDATRVLTDLLAASGLDCKADARLARPAGAVSGSSALPRVVHREHPEVLALVRRLLGVSRFDDCSLIEEDLRRGRVLRLTCELDAGVRRVVVKRFAADRARVEQAVLRRWLPSVGLAHLAPKLLGVAVESAGGHVWHAYEDLGDFSLDHESRFASRGAADRGFLSPLRQSPEREHLELVVDAIAAVHESFEGHALLGECRRESTGFGSRSLRESVDEAIEALQRWESTARDAEAERRLDTREDLLEILQRVRAECDWRGRLVEQLGGPDTLLHGDLGVRNALACMTARGMTGMLIDWDHAGVGPVSYDLSTLLMQLPAADRRWVLRRYQARRARDGGWPTHKQWNLLFETAELSRLASCVIGPAMAAAGEPEWALDDLAKIRVWFGSLTPVLPDEDADAASVGGVAARQESREA
ncbi:MAG TPA: phosphotransferase, partial [Vicinamibacterales bacterium]|nr:phosphotransferase [Vicinamibacterales bacterium]